MPQETDDIGIRGSVARRRTTLAASGICVAAPGGVRTAILLYAALSLAGCNIGQLGDAPTYQSTSPGMVTFKLDLPSTRLFCDDIATCGYGVYHVSFADLNGHGFQIATSF